MMLYNNNNICDKIRLLRASKLIKNSLLFRHWGIVPKGQSFWDENAVNKFKELIEKCNGTGMIAIIKGIEPGPNEEVYRIILVASNGQKINQEMIRLNLADPNRKDDSGYNSSPLNPRSKLEAETLAKAVQGLLITI